MNDKQLALYIGQKIKENRLRLGMTQKELASKIDMGDTTIVNYEKGIRTPKKKTLFKIAEVFRVSIDDLFPPTSSPNTTKPTTPTSSQVIKLDKELNTDNHEKWVDYGESLLDSQNTQEVYEEQVLYTYDYYDQALSAGTGQYLNDVRVEQIELPVDIDADFVVPVYGNSMEPEYYTGDYVFVELSVELSDGDIGVFEYYGDAYIKELLINEKGAFLHSLNPEYTDLPVDSDSDFRIIGKVVGKYRVG